MGLPFASVTLDGSFLLMFRSDTSSTVDGARAGCCMVGVKYYERVCHIARNHPVS